MQVLTVPQQRVLDFIRSTVAARGFPPTWQEIGAHMGFASGNAVSGHVEALVKKGRLSREKGRPRTLRVIEPAARR